ncbi:MAG: GAF domain-containing protein [Nitrospirae bacterium]|nr:GAF domain-containing protein [Nitrospirota bacterium]
MNDDNKSKDQLLEELAQMRLRVSKLESEVTAQMDSEERYRQIVQSTMDAIILFDITTKRIIDISRAAEKMYGYGRHEFLKLTINDIATEQVASDNSIKEIESRQCMRIPVRYHKRKDGSVFPVEMSGSFIPLYNGQKAALGIIRDITERMLTEEIIQVRMRLLEFSPGHTLEELLRKTLDEVGMLVDSPIGFYHFVENDQKTLSLQAWSSLTLEKFCKAEGKGLHYSIENAGVWVDCVHQRKPVIHNDYPSLAHRKGLPQGHAHVARELVVPIFRDERIVAILGVGNKPADYTELDVSIVSYLADVAWEIVKHKYAEEALQKRNDELQRFHNLAVDRELSIIELKREVNELLKKSGQEEKYRIVG